MRLALPAMQALARSAPRLRCELVEAEPEQALPELALGEIDVVIGDEWNHQPWPLPAGLELHELLRDPVRLVVPQDHPARRLSELAGATWVCGHPGMGWDAMLRRACRELGGFEPDIRHRTNDATIALAVVASGLAVTLLPELAIFPHHTGIALRELEDAGVERVMYAVTRAADARRPSTQAVLREISALAAAR
jgi:DNA-binding transcriptional LysR family regulator